MVHTVIKYQPIETPDSEGSEIDPSAKRDLGNGPDMALHDPENSSSEGDGIHRSLGHVEKQLRNVIDMMGPHTPKLPSFVSSSDADNEDSLYSSTSIISSVLKENALIKKVVQLKHITKTDRITERKTPRRGKERQVMPSENMYEESRNNEERRVDRAVRNSPIHRTVYHHPNNANIDPNLKDDHGRLTCPSNCYAHRSYNEQVLQQMHTMDMVEPWMKKKYSSRIKGVKENKSRIMDWFVFNRSSKCFNPSHKSQELYKIEMEQSRDSHSPPRRFVFDLVEGPPANHCTEGTCAHQAVPPENFCRDCGCQNNKPVTPEYFCRDCGCQNKNVYHAVPMKNYCSGGRLQTSYACNRVVDGHDMKNECYAQPTGGRKKYPKCPKKEKFGNDNKEPERIDLYYFDHGNSAFYRTTDCPPLLFTDQLAQKTENSATKFWAEIFGTAHIGCAFIISFFLQFLRFVLYSVLRPLTVGVIQLMSDYFLKPLLAALFNGIIQPPLIMFYNVATSVRDVCEPMAQGIGFFIYETARLLAAIRFVEVHKPQEKKTVRPSKAVV